MSVRDDTQPPPAAHRNSTGASTEPVATPGDRTLISARALAAGFGPQPVFHGIDLTVRPGETVAIVGRSGCGKTTLLHVLAGLALPTAGTVEAEPAALMAQRDGLMPWATATANAALPLRVAKVPRREARLAAAGQLRALGLGDALDRPVAALSGGMRQRVALARTLLTGRKLLLLDEPLASVDALTRSELHGLLLRHLARDGHGAVLVTHDLDEAALLADRILVLGPPPQARGGATKTSTLRPGPALSGAPGQRLEHRGGDAVRDALLADLA